jgi:hypothetical protein
MPLLTVEGIYRDGKVELAENPGQIDDAVRVIVTFLVEECQREGSKVRPVDERETLRQQAFAQMKKGVHLGGPPYPKREELYDRFDR